MVTVVGKDERLKKRVTCRACASILEYWPSEVCSRTHTDYGGGRERYNVIVCPCGSDVEVR